MGRARYGEVIVVKIKKRIGYLPKRPTYRLLGGWINEHPAGDEEL
jgi:hypothetical protein